MPKNVVLCCDGTANEFAQNRTNVVKLFGTLVQDPARQVTYYHPGLGTMEPPGALTDIARKMTRLLGKAIGYGLESDIRDAYVFIMNNFEPGDKLFLFGFSRGAYTVRALAALVHMYGLLRPGNEPMVPYAIRLLTSIENASDPKSFFELAIEFQDTLAQKTCQPWFVGVWDTVSSVGWVGNPLKLPYTTNNPDIHIGRHAISIDEKRAFFRTNLWKLPQPAPPSGCGPKDLKQVWFPGVHCDVGGGYPEAESGLAKIALEWMFCEARAAGLLLDDDKVLQVLGRKPSSRPTLHYVQPDAKAGKHRSLKPAWWIAEFIPKRHYNYQTQKKGWRLNLFRSRPIPPGSHIHESAYLQGDDYVKKFPTDAIRVTCGQYPECTLGAGA